MLLKKTLILIIAATAVNANAANKNSQSALNKAVVENISRALAADVASCKQQTACIRAQLTQRIIAERDHLKSQIMTTHFIQYNRLIQTDCDNRYKNDPIQSGRCKLFLYKRANAQVGQLKQNR